MKILITGGDGYIASSLFEHLNKYHDVLVINRQNFDLKSNHSTKIFFSDKFFDVVIHCAVKGGSRLKDDLWSDMDDNLIMYYNLLENSSRFNKFIHFGSGAELYSISSPYGLSKHVIRQSILEKDRFFNLRIFAVFDENELDTRFIKTNIRRYINKEPMEVYQDKYMDFIYMKDLIKIINYYIDNENLPKEINCTYNTTYSLTKITQIINNLDYHKVNVIEKGNRGVDYIGNGIPLSIDFIGLEKGIREVYEKLKNAK